MHIDPEATLRCWPVAVDVGGDTYRIPALPASAWLVAVHGTWTGIVPGMLEDADDLDDAIADGHVPHAECVRAARAAVEAAAGTRWWTASRLAHTAGDTVGAELLLRGVDADRVSFAAWLLAAYRVATRHAKDVDIAQLDAQLDAPPEGLRPEEWFGDDSQTLASFGAAMASTSGRNQGRATSRGR